MRRFTFTHKAASDLDDIIRYTVRTWGTNQCAAYVDGLEACFLRLARKPDLGSSCDAIRPGLRRQAQGRHIIFYEQRAYGIRIVRILHGRMWHERHDLEGDGDDDL